MFKQVKINCWTYIYLSANKWQVEADKVNLFPRYKHLSVFISFQLSDLKFQRPFGILSMFIECIFVSNTGCAISE